ncbi:MAG: NADH:flavin oxidoreductase, partial [Chloroflexi bacterium]|nr:NADH:flavin oxidoreductase [Chloroflexota bacterium]
MSSPQFQHLFTPFTIGPMTVRNRIAVPGHNTNFMPSDGPPTERMLHYWLTKARGGVGMITTHVHSVLPRHTGAPPTALQSDDWIPSYRKVVDALHDEGVKFLLQLNHVGARGSSRPFGGVIMAPSAVPMKSFLASGTEIPHEMDAEDIQDVIEAFRQAAVRAREAGFDGVEVQGEVSFMVAQFMSPAKNLRQDEYGGSLDNRLRFAREVIAAVRDGIGSDRVVGIRLSGDEISEGGLTLDDMLEITPLLEATGNLDFIHVGAGPGISAHIPPTYYKAGGFVYLAEAIRKVVKLPLMCSQRINDPLIAEDILARGIADLVAMNRAIMTDPEMPRKA